MKERQPYVLIDIRWLPLPASLKYPAMRAFGSTGYREADGPAGLFSVYLETLTGEPGPGNVQSAKLYASAHEKQSTLPEIGSKFFLSMGPTVVAECIARDRAGGSHCAVKPVTLYRPVGPKELQLIADSGWQEFPPRLPEQPIFYPVVQMEYAIRIARDWNVKASGSGFVMRFDVDAAYLSRFDIQHAGGQEHAEYWIPAEQLNEFNRNIVGMIEVVAEFHKDAD